MARPTQRRGLQIMRTQSTRKAAGSLSSPEMYLRMTSLEMERARRVMERDRLLERVRLLDQRIATIAQEQTDLRTRLDLNDPLLADLRDQSRSSQHDHSPGFTY